MTFVLDASVALTWLFKEPGARSDSYAFEVLALIRAPDAAIHVPVIWSLEIANVLARSEANGLVTPAQSASFLELLDAAPIVVDATSASRALTETLQLARRYRLSAYDASYLELALRAGVPLATLDEALKRAATKAGLSLLKVV